MSPKPPPPSGYLTRYDYTVDTPPGVNVRTLRLARGLSMRQLAAQCQPPTDPAAITRVEHNQQCTQQVLERIASGLQVPLWVLLAPLELAAYHRLSPAARQRVSALIDDIVISDRYRRTS